MKLYNFSDNKKEYARYEFVRKYREWAGNVTLPAHLEYWTMGSRCATLYGTPLTGSEIEHLIDIGLIAENQFHSVELNENINLLNRKAYPIAKWYDGDFLRVLKNEDCMPGIVNIDTIYYFDKGINYIGSILDMLSYHPQEMMAIGNVIMEQKWRGYCIERMEDIYLGVKGNRRIQRSIRNGWSARYAYCYHRNGTGMFTILFFKNGV